MSGRNFSKYQFLLMIFILFDVSKAKKVILFDDDQCLWNKWENHKCSMIKEDMCLYCIDSNP